MSGVRPVRKPGAHSASYRVALLAAGTVALAGLMPALAQETSALRGEVAEDTIRTDLLSRKPLVDQPTRLDPKPEPGAEQANGLPETTYVPVSDEPDEPLDPGASLFTDTEAEKSAFGEPVETPKIRKPSTAKQRADAANKAAMKAPTGKATDEEPKPGARVAANAEEELSTGTARTGRVDSETADPFSTPAEAAAAIDAIDREAEADPYAAVGIRAGTFVLRPSLETGLTYTTNADSDSTPDPSFLSESTLRLNATSEWSRNLATIDAYGTFRKNISGAPVEDTEAGVDAELQLELGNEFRLTAKGGYVRKPESASSPVAIVGVASRPLRQTLDGSLALAKDVGKARFTVTGGVERDWYGDATLSTGGVLSQKDRASTLATVALRAGYEISPAITPFAELEYGRRLMDLRLDSSGYARSATRLAARGGLEFNLSEKFNGQMSAGWISEALDDSRLSPISGATVAADLAWSPLRGTTVAFNGTTTVEGTTTAGESGSILYSGRVSIDHRLRASLTGNVALGAALRDYAGSTDTDLTLSAEGSLTWWLNRYAGLTTRARHETVTSTLPGRGSETNSIFVGLKFQR